MPRGFTATWRGWTRSLRALPASLAGGDHVADEVERDTDSVPRGGNFDGYAGVVAGIAAAAALRQSGIVPPRDVTVMAIRAEELSAWYGGSHDGHIGSRAALGLLPQPELDTAIHARSGKSLREHMRMAGYAPEAVGTPHLDPARCRGYLELHIEQGPVLEARGIPVGLVTAIRGAARARSCRCLGEYTHSGAVPHEYRSDAVMATVELVRELDRHWDSVRGRGGDLTFTVGKLYTDADVHALTKVPGETGFTLEFRSQDVAILAEASELAQQLAAAIGAKRRVRFELGGFSLQRPAQMSAEFRGMLRDGCDDLGISALAMPSGAGHDAQDFVHAGIPAAMVFVRNANGSHNALEAMDLADFALGTRLLAWMLLRS